MVGKIKGLDQISAWVGGILAAGAVMTIVWYGTKFYVGKEEEKRSAEIAATIREIEDVKIDARENGATHAQSEHKAQNDEAPNRLEQAMPHQNYGYSGNLAPWYWANLSDKWHRCGSETGQSPIDLSGATLDEKLKSLKIYYQHGTASLSFQHQTLKIRVERGSYLEWEGERFDLEHVYTRTPSEHRVSSLPFDMEIQLEHMSINHKKLMVSVLIVPGKSNPLIERLAQNIPTIPEDTREIARVTWADVLPRKKTYWTYMGSSTIPPCEEDVRWIIFTDESSSSKSAIDHFVLRQKSNVRPVFSLGTRSLTRSNR